MGVITSHTSSKGRQSYGTQFKLVVPPEAIGKVCFPDWWDGVWYRERYSTIKTHQAYSIQEIILSFLRITKMVVEGACSFYK